MEAGQNHFARRAVPGLAENRVSILIFITAPLSYSLVDARISHPVLFPDDLSLGRMKEREWVLECRLGEP